jgi:hypothetical protein
MMPCQYITQSGTQGTLDLDAVVDVAKAMSGRRPTWSALLIYDPKAGLLVELRDSPQDVRGNSQDEAEEVDEAYVQEHFGLSSADLSELRRNPKAWRLNVNRKQDV